MSVYRLSSSTTIRAVMHCLMLEGLCQADTDSGFSSTLAQESKGVPGSLACSGPVHCLAQSRCLLNERLADEQPGGGLLGKKIMSCWDGVDRWV